MTPTHTIDVNGTPAPFTAAQFWERVARTDTCWEWIGARQPTGYGQFSVRANGRPTTIKAHRMAWELLVGEPIPDGQEINHLCRNRGCVNPAHLEVVTTAANSRYAYVAAWPVLPEGSWGDRVQRAMLDLDVTGPAFARLMGVSESTVSSWANGRSTARPRVQRKLDVLLRGELEELSA